jgi:hypothetical protein
LAKRPDYVVENAPHRRVVGDDRAAGHVAILAVSEMEYRMLVIPPS